MKRSKIILSAFALAAVIALSVGLGVGLSRRDRGDSSPSSSDASEAASSTSSLSPNATQDLTYSASDAFNLSGIWQPSLGTSWQIILEPIPDSALIPSRNFSVYDIDLFTTNSSVIRLLQSPSFGGARIICYFSAGTFEDFRPDSAQFLRSDYGLPLKEWHGEWWLDTKSVNVRRIMLGRLDLAVSKGCDAVDPDNVDGYANDSGLGLTSAGAVEYMTFLAAAAHRRGLAIGLKNADALVPDTVDFLQFTVNESCDVQQECALWQPFVSQRKPVFHIAYPDNASPELGAQAEAQACQSPDTNGFSTILKRYSHVDDWVYVCPTSGSQSR